MNRSVGLGIISLIVTLSVTANEACARESLQILASKTKRAVILIRHFDAGGRSKSQGTGFFITSDGLFVTNHHMLSQPALQKKKA
jgi:S1-C subfamily serine protease